MTGKKRNGARAADLALYAPLVLLPFVWFALGACIAEDVPPEARGMAGPPQPDGQYGNTPYYSYPDYTQYGQNVVCTRGGGYGGGSDSEMSATRASLANAVDAHKRRIAEFENQAKQCAGKEISDAQLDAQFGCNRQLEQAFYNAPANWPRTPEMVAAQKNCMQPGSVPYGAPTCRHGSVAFFRSRQDDIRGSMAADQARLDNIDACIKDKKRREDAARRPQMDPNAALGIIQGLQGYGRRPSGGSSGQGGYSGGQHGNHKH